MAQSFEDFMNSQKNVANLASIAEAAKSTQKSGFDDERFWKPTVDKGGNGYFVGRLLPNKNGGTPWKRWWDHGFKTSSGQWFFENCLTSLSTNDNRVQCPVCEDNSRLWALNTNEAQNIARNRKRRLHYVSNIMILKDKDRPENEGKIFFYVYGKKIFDKIIEKISPQFPDEVPMDVFNILSGASFRIKICTTTGTDGQSYWNYDRSDFGPSEPLFKDESKLKSVFDQLLDLDEVINASKYLSYDAMQKKFFNMTKGSSGPIQSSQREDNSNNETVENVNQVIPEADEDDEDLAYFRKLASQV